MADQPEALRLADWVETNPAIRQEPASAVAAELRRLHDIEKASLRDALAQEEQEPVAPYAWMAVGGSIWRHKTSEDDVPLYTQPPRREWQSLTDAELRKAYLSVSGNEWCLGGMANAESFYEAIEAKLKEKNNG